MKKVAYYEQDLLTWTQKQAEYLQKGHWSELDIENLIEDLEALGRSEQKELISYFQLLVMHLPKYQTEKRTPSWNNTLSNCRNKIQDCLEDTPNLKRFLEDIEWIEKYYQRARTDAAKETQKSLQIFSTEGPYTIAKIPDREFFS